MYPSHRSSRTARFLHHSCTSATTPPAPYAFFDEPARRLAAQTTLNTTSTPYIRRRLRRATTATRLDRCIGSSLRGLPGLLRSRRPTLEPRRQAPILHDTLQQLHQPCAIVSPTPTRPPRAPRHHRRAGRAPEPSQPPESADETTRFVAVAAAQERASLRFAETTEYNTLREAAYRRHARAQPHTTPADSPAARRPPQLVLEGRSVQVRRLPFVLAALFASALRNLRRAQLCLLPAPVPARTKTRRTPSLPHRSAAYTARALHPPTLPSPPCTGPR